jgi:hypothetical protein
VVVGASVVVVVVVSGSVVLVVVVVDSGSVVLVVVVDSGSVVLVVVVVVLPVPAQTCDNTKLTSPVSGEMFANDVAWTMSVIACPVGTATNTLSVWIPLGMIWLPLNVNDVPFRSSVIETNEKLALFGAVTKCQ